METPRLLKKAGLSVQLSPIQVLKHDSELRFEQETVRFACFGEADITFFLSWCLEWRLGKTELG